MDPTSQLALLILECIRAAAVALSAVVTIASFVFLIGMAYDFVEQRTEPRRRSRMKELEDHRVAAWEEARRRQRAEQRAKDDQNDMDYIRQYVERNHFGNPDEFLANVVEYVKYRNITRKG